MKNKCRIKVKLISIFLFIIFVSKYSYGSGGLEYIILGKEEYVSYDECLEVLQKGNQIYSKTVDYGDTEDLDLRIIYGEYIYFFNHSIDMEEIGKPKNIDKDSILYKLLEGEDTLKKKRIEGSYIMCNGKYKLNFVVEIIKE